MSVGNEWNESLCGCCSDCGSCLCGCFCPPCLYGRNSEKIEDGSCCLRCCAYIILIPVYLHWLPHYFTRRTLRQRYALRKDPCGDCPTAFCCSPCALCQEARFLKRQGPAGVVVGGQFTTNQPRQY